MLPTPFLSSAMLPLTVEYASETAPPTTGIQLDITYLAVFEPRVSADEPTML